jgi:hypothetical protein
MVEEDLLDRYCRKQGLQTVNHHANAKAAKDLSQDPNEQAEPSSKLLNFFSRLVSIVRWRRLSIHIQDIQLISNGEY